MHSISHTIGRTLAALLLAAAMPLAQARVILADWTFSDAVGTTLNHTLNTGAGLNGPGSSCSVAITGVQASGDGTLVVGNVGKDGNDGNDGKGGSGTRSDYADFGPAFDQLGSGTVSLFARLSSWHTALPARQQSISFGFIEGIDFLTAGMRLRAGQGGFALDGQVDDGGDGEAITGAGGVTVVEALILRLQLNLDLHRYALGYDAGNGFITLGNAAIDSATAGVNSLRFGSAGDFSSNPLHIDRIWLVQEDAVPLPEPVTALLLAGVAALLLARRRPVRRPR